MELAHLDTLVAPELTALDQEMARILTTDHPFLTELNQRIMAKPGKRLRPKLLFLCSKMLGYEGPLAARYAAVFELIHTATLIHDDIIDEAKIRRGQNTLNHLLGNTLTVLYGDLLYTKAHTTAIEAGSLEVLHTITWVSERMIEGELLQNKVNFDVAIDEATYFDILRRKTAYLFAGTTKAAGLLANQSPEAIEKLFQFGFHFGISFQLIDDYLDYVGKEHHLGKPVFQDLGEGKVTLPIIQLLEQGRPELAQQIQDWWQHPDQEAPDTLKTALAETSVLEDTRKQAERYAAKAITYLDGFSDNHFTQILRSLPQRLLSRTK